MSALPAPRAAADPDCMLEDFYRRYENDVYHVAVRLLGSHEEAEDVTQTTFLNAYRALGRGNAPRNPRAWLLTIAENLCHRAFRMRARGPTFSGVDPEVVEAPTDADAPTAAQIRSAVKRLPLSQSAVLLLRECRGLTYAEIARRLGLTLPAVETILFRARRALRAELELVDVTPSVVPAPKRRRRLGGLLPLPSFGKLLGWFEPSASHTGLAGNAPALVAAVVAAGVAVSTAPSPPASLGAASPQSSAHRTVSAAVAASTTGPDLLFRLQQRRETPDLLGAQRGQVENEGFREHGSTRSEPPAQTDAQAGTPIPAAVPDIQPAVRLGQVPGASPSLPLPEPSAPTTPALKAPSLPKTPSLPAPPAAPELPPPPIPPPPIDLP